MTETNDLRFLALALGLLEVQGGLKFGALEVASLRAVLEFELGEFQRFLELLTFGSFFLESRFKFMQGAECGLQFGFQGLTLSRLIFELALDCLQGIRQALTFSALALELCSGLLPGS